MASPSTLPVLDEILGGEACFSEFDIRETRDRDTDGQMLFHHEYVTISPPLCSDLLFLTQCPCTTT